MTVSDCYDLDTLLREAECILQIDARDYENTDIDAVISGIRKRLTKAAGIDFVEHNLTDDDIAWNLNQTEVVMFVNSLAEIHSRLAGLCQVQRYLTKTPVSLSSVNYLGFTAESMKSVLIDLQRKATLPKAKEAIKAIREKLIAIDNCREKRLFMIMVVADVVGCSELVSTIAELLYQGTLKR